MNTEKSRSTLNVLFCIKKHKLLKSGEDTIIRITIDGRRQEIMIKRSIPAEQWNQAKECSNSSLFPLVFCI